MEMDKCHIGSIGKCENEEKHAEWKENSTKKKMKEI